VAVDLTERGELELDKITEAVFSYLALLRAKTNGEGGREGGGGGGIPKYVYEECQTLADLGWRFQVGREGGRDGHRLGFLLEERGRKGGRVKGREERR